MATNKQISARIPKDLYQRFTDKLEKEGKQSGKVLQQLIESYCDDNLPSGSNALAVSSGEDEEVKKQETDIKQLVAEEVAFATQHLEGKISQLETAISEISKVADGSTMVEPAKVEDDSTLIADGSTMVEPAKVEDDSTVVAGDSTVVASNEIKILRTSGLSKRLGITEKEIRGKAQYKNPIIGQNVYSGKMEKWDLYSEWKKGKKVYEFCLVDSH